MELRHERKKKAQEEKKRQWEIEFEQLKQELEDKYNEKFPKEEEEEVLTQEQLL